MDTLEITYENKKKRPIEKWMSIANDFNDGIPTEKILDKHRRKDGKKHNRGYIYWCIRQLEAMGLVTINRKK